MPVIRQGGQGYLVDLALEARLFGRVRLLTVDATIAVAEDGTPLVGPAPIAVDPPPGTGLTLGRGPASHPGAPCRSSPPRVRLAEATRLLRDARTVLDPIDGGREAATLPASRVVKETSPPIALSGS